MSRHSPLLNPSPILDFDHQFVKNLIQEKGWRGIEKNQLIGNVYDFVGNEMYLVTTSQTIFQPQRCWRMAMGNATPKERFS